MELTENILNVTEIEPRLKHPTIFARFDELEEGESLTIHNDHDPKPLYYQLLGERGNIFKWEYLEQGPVWWKVRISKRNLSIPDETIGQIAAKDLHKAKVFKKYGLDFCCGGKKTIKEACSEKGLDVTKVEQELHELDKINAFGGRQLPYNDWEVDFLSDYIVNTHHSYLNKNLPDLKRYAQRVAEVHGDNHPELLAVNQQVQLLANELTTHLIKEEKILFPYLKILAAAVKNNEPLHVNPFGDVQQPVNMMEMEHDVAGEILERLKELTNNYTLPKDACATFSLLYRTLEEMTEDLHLHIHLENNILFPKAIALEKKLRTAL